MNKSLRSSLLRSSLLDLDRLDRLGSLDTAVHRLDPRAKLLTAMVLVVLVVSFPKYTVSALVPFFLFPLTLAAAGRLPLGYLAGKLLLVAPFAVLLAAANPLLDRRAVLHLGTLAVTGGWLSFTSVLLRVALTVGTGLVLIGVTGFRDLCSALQRCGVPAVLTTQLLLLYRYLFVLGEEATRLQRARALRSFKGRGFGLQVYTSMAGSLLLRSIDRARRIHLAMLARGFTGELHWRQRRRFGVPDLLFVPGWCTVLVLCRVHDLPLTLGRWIVGGVS